MNVKSLKSQLFAAVVMMLVACVALGSSTYAWFAMNTEVTATGMSVTTEVKNNLLIANGVAGTGMSAETDYKSATIQSVEAALQPVSTADGVKYFYTYKAKADGNAELENYTALVGNAIVIGSGETAENYQGYADYIFDLKATNTSDAPQTIKLTKLNLLYNDSVVSGDKAARVAMFVQTGGNTQATAAGAFGATANAIYTIDGAENFDNGKAIVAATDNPETAEINECLGDVTYNAAVDSMTVAAGVDQYYKVTLRLWIEGEDTTCYSSNFKTLDQAWTLDVEFELGGTNPAVTTIGSAVPST